MKKIVIHTFVSPKSNAPLSVQLHLPGEPRVFSWGTLKQKYAKSLEP